MFSEDTYIEITPSKNVEKKYNSSLTIIVIAVLLSILMSSIVVITALFVIVQKTHNILHDSNATRIGKTGFTDQQNNDVKAHFYSGSDTIISSGSGSHTLLLDRADLDSNYFSGSSASNFICEQSMNYVIKVSLVSDNRFSNATVHLLLRVIDSIDIMQQPIHKIYFMDLYSYAPGYDGFYFIATGALHMEKSSTTKQIVLTVDLGIFTGGPIFIPTGRATVDIY